MTDEITMLRIGDRVKAPTVSQFEEGTVEDISYRYEPHPKDTPFEPYGPPIPTVCVDVDGRKAWHDIETLRKVKNALPEREDQNLREVLDTAILNAAGDFFNQDEINVKGLSAVVQTDEKTYRHIYVKNGFTYEVSVRCVAWPGMEDAE